MATITERRRKDGSIGYTAQIKIKRGGKVVFSKAQTFDRRQAAEAWTKRVENEVSTDAGLRSAIATKEPTLGDAIDRYIEESEHDMGKTKAQVMRAIREDPISEIRASEITSEDLVTYARNLVKDRKPQTVLNYLSHLSSVFRVARAAWGIQLDRDSMQDALIVTKRLGVTNKSRKRDRRPTIKELDALIDHFRDRQSRRNMIPMDRIILFALYSTRRQEEITRIRWQDLEAGRILVRDMKNPGEKIGNHVWCSLVPEAEAVIASMPRKKHEIFPYSTDAISANFTRACKLLGIEDLHFHDLRHEGVSRLFELGWSIPHAAEVSGHRSWQSLQRYSHIRQVGDKYEGWKHRPET